MYQININDSASKYTLDRTNEEVYLNGDKLNWNIAEISENIFSVIANGKSYSVILEHIDKSKKQVELTINGQTYLSSIHEPIDQLLLKMGIDTKKSKGADTIKAPMPGLVLKILVENGQSLKKGDPVLILEAMKMENVFKSPENAIVKNILVHEKKAVEKGEVLIELE